MTLRSFSALAQHQGPGKKAQFQDRLVWCGWDDSIQLMSAKLAGLVEALLSQKQVVRKTLERAVGGTCKT